MSLKSKLLLEANKNLEIRYVQNKFTLNEQKVNYVDLANKKLSELKLTSNLLSYLPQNPITELDFLCIPKTGDESKDSKIKSVSTWIDNNMDNKGLIEVKLNELSKLLKVVNLSKVSGDLSEQLGSDSIMFGNTPITKEESLSIGNELVFLLVMSLVHPKLDSKIERKFCVK
jgi:hypothetical protein